VVERVRSRQHTRVGRVVLRDDRADVHGLGEG
jgi:hypothetical protein